MCAMSPRLLRPRTTFNPRSIAGLAAWYDAADLRTLSQTSDGSTPATANDDFVAYVADKSPLARHMTQTDNNKRPQLKLSAQNSLPVLKFDGDNDTLFAANYLSGIIPTVFVVAQREADTQVATVFSCGRSTDTRPLEVTARNNFLSPANNLRFRLGTTAFQRKNGGTALDLGSSPTAFFIGAGAYSQDVSISNSGDPVFMGAQRGGVFPFGDAFFLNGRIGEVIVYSRSLVLTEIQTIEKYLSRKWGVAIA
jgi:hypothetical protein